MADYDSGLPIRSEADGLDERVVVKIQDGADPGGVGKTVEVSESKAHVRVHGKDSDSADKEILLSQEGHVQSNGDYDASTNKRPSSQGLIVSDRDAAPSESTMNKRPTAVAGESDSICLDISLKDHAGQAFDADNPLYVVATDDPGTEIEDFDQAVNIAKDAISSHDYTTTSEFRSLNADCSASGKARFELQVETGVGAGTFDTVAVKFSSTSNPNVTFALKKPKSIATGIIIRIAKKNLDNQVQDLYSTINGVEI